MSTPASTLDLSNCDREPIRIPGTIQPHGFLLTLSDALHVLQASENVLDLAGCSAESVIGSALEAVIGAPAAAQLASALSGQLAARPSYVGTVTARNGRHFDVMAHRWDELLIVEFEQVDRSAPADFRELYPFIGDFLLKVNDTACLESLARSACQHIRSVTGFGRVLVYKFDADGHGHVTAEAKADSYASYMNQHFPASDIPAQARELYALSRIRLIQDASYRPSPLVPSVNPRTGRPNDLSFAALRSVSPFHLQYMRNMSTMASMSVSLMVKGRLWGLVSCHNENPKAVPFEKRTACEQLAQILALCIESREDAAELQFRLDVRRTMLSVLGKLTQSGDFIDNLSGVFPDLLRFARASGLAVVMDEHILMHGDTPDREEIEGLVDWLSEHDGGELFHTDQLSAVYTPGVAFMRNASGLLAMPISRIHKHYLLWFRREYVHTIEWAGHPHDKLVQAAAVQAPLPLQLSPRTSFAAWRETIHGISRPWHGGEIELAVEFRSALLGIVLERAEQIAALAGELGRSNRELEAFSYSVSHDLRAPLRHIVGFSDLLLESAGQEDTQQRQRFLSNIKESARMSGKLVDDLLSFSQMGRAALNPVPVDLNAMTLRCLEKMEPDISGRTIEWDIAPLPQAWADPAFLEMAVFNLFSNAIKFTAHQASAVICVSGEDLAEETVLHVTDNGVGFDMKYVHKLFGVFQRLHRMEDFEGTGIGLANVRRAVERHHGRAWAKSTLGEGATFSISLPKKPSAS